MNEALELAEEMQRYGVTTMNRWATDGAAMLRSQHAEIESWKKDQKENQKLRDALINVARKAESLKRECGDDPESPQAIRNGMYMHLSYVARAALGETK